MVGRSKDNIFFSLYLIICIDHLAIYSSIHMHGSKVIFEDVYSLYFLYFLLYFLTFYKNNIEIIKTIRNSVVNLCINFHSLPESYLC